ncbi:VCBS repeat-containing protein [Candidatus Woesearchaeota archaeon]|nr:VCBS repeat-containing protein [Candidatus Woesearchaeota archaeon]
MKQSKTSIKSLIYIAIPLGLSYASIANPINAQRLNGTDPYTCTLLAETDENPQDPTEYFTSIQNLRAITDTLLITSSYASDLDNDGDAEVVVITNTGFRVLENRIKETEVLDKLFSRMEARLENY